jgi:hypothetical protein
MSKISDFIAIFGAHQTLKSARKVDAQDVDSELANGYADPDVYSSLDVEDIYDEEELENAIDEEWD